MKQKEFDKLVEHRMEVCKETLGLKAKHYATVGDRLHNFKDGAFINNCTPEQYALSLVTKHIVAIKDAILSGKLMSEEFAEEKIGDIINYMLLIEALNTERRNND